MFVRQDCATLGSGEWVPWSVQFSPVWAFVHRPLLCVQSVWEDAGIMFNRWTVCHLGGGHGSADGHFEAPKRNQSEVLLLCTKWKIAGYREWWWKAVHLGPQHLCTPKVREMSYSSDGNFSHSDCLDCIWKLHLSCFSFPTNGKICRLILPNMGVSINLDSPQFDQLDALGSPSCVTMCTYEIWASVLHKFCNFEWLTSGV